jgi:hypothetical protein
MVNSGCNGGMSSTTATSPTSVSSQAMVTTKTPTVTVPPTWSLETDCATCHPDQVNSMTDPALLAFNHALISNKCVGCHDLATLQVSHKDFSSTSSVPYEQYPQSFCLKCHGSYPVLVALTANSTAFLDPDGKAINPHDTHVGQVECYKCHLIHDVSPGIKYCYSCHHTKTLECGECH